MDKLASLELNTGLCPSFVIRSKYAFVYESILIKHLCGVYIIGTVKIVTGVRSVCRPGRLSSLIIHVLFRLCIAALEISCEAHRIAAIIPSGLAHHQGARACEVPMNCYLSEIIF